MSSAGASTDMRDSLGITLDPLDADPLTLPSGMQPWEPWPPKLAETLFLQRLTELLDKSRTRWRR